MTSPMLPVARLFPGAALRASRAWPQISLCAAPLWEQARRQSRDQAARGKTRATKAGPSPLAGKLFDEDGECLYVAGAAKGERRYRYYLARRLVTGSADKVRNGWRLSGPEIERTVAVAAHSSSIITRPSVPLLAISALAQAIFPPCWKRQANGAGGSSQKRIARQH